MSTLLMGIVNRTRDSFSGDGSLSLDETLQRIDQLIADGADIIDLGAESTRPGATPLSEKEEWTRLEPVLKKLKGHPKRAGFLLSLDSYHARTVAKALEYGIDIVNDVSGLSTDAMLQVLSRWDGDIIVMHSLTVPADPEITWEESTDPVAEILRWKQSILQRGATVNIDSTRIIFDPGIGFGKTTKHSLELVNRAEELVDSGGRWLVGHSRKRFLAPAEGDSTKARDAATLALSEAMAKAGVHILRVHDVARHDAMLDELCM